VVHDTPDNTFEKVESALKALCVRLLYFRCYSFYLLTLSTAVRERETYLRYVYELKTFYAADL
jgi:hypothetical protein